VRVAGVLVSFIFGVLLTAGAAAQEQHQHPAGDPQQLGEVHFPNSCHEAVQKKFNRAVAMLHSFWYEMVAARFTEITQQDPSCAMAYWGIAMSHYHPLWETPGKESLQAGKQAIEKGQAIGARTQREQDYVAALASFYRDFDKVDHLTRVRDYEEAMQRLHQNYPEDKEAAIFYALSLLGTATAAAPDPGFAKQKQAGKILAKLFPEQPNHPGLAHYIIHSYDYPPLAALGLEAARRYAKISPDSPHAQHMPSHIFTRLGLWEESIDSNLNSAAAARRHADTGDELHALDYLMYAYLQLGRDQEAGKLLDQLPETKPGTATYLAGIFGRAAMPARYVLERRDWPAAAKLKIPVGLFPGGRYAWTEATLHFARGLGAVRTGNTETAREIVTLLKAARETLRQAKEDYWVEQVDVQRLTVAAWLALAEGNQREAVEFMRAAADREDELGKHPVTPGAIAPARELLGEMLLEVDRPQEALAEFEAVLRSAPNRFNAFYGVARAAERAGDEGKAREYYGKLAELAAAGDGDRPAIKKAHAFLARK